MYDIPMTAETASESLSKHGEEAAYQSSQAHSRASLAQLFEAVDESELRDRRRVISTGVLVGEISAA